jgi:hypothetical protein
VAGELGLDCIGIDLSEAFCKVITRRMQETVSGPEEIEMEIAEDAA